MFFRLLLVASLLSVTLGTFCVHAMDAPQSVEKFAKSMMTEDMNEEERTRVINAFRKVPPEKWNEFKKIAKSMMTEDMEGRHHEAIISTFGNVFPEKWNEFKKIAESLIMKDKYGANHSTIIRALGNVPPEKLTESFKKITKSMMTEDMSGEDRENIIKAFGKFPPEKWNEFKKIAESMMTEDMEGLDRSDVIDALGNAPPEKWKEFKEFAESMMTEDMCRLSRADVIQALGGVPLDKWNEFKEVTESMMTKDMIGENRANIIKALAMVPPKKWNEFKDVADSMMAKDMIGENRANVIDDLKRVSVEKRDQIQRLMENTRVRFTESQHAESLIRTLREFETVQQAQAFVTGVIGLVEADPVLVDGNRLMTHMQTMKTRMQGITSQDLRELLRSRQSTHMKEVHESIAESLKRLQVRYPTPLPYPGNICDMVSGVLVSLFPEDPECVANAKHALLENYGHLNIQSQINELLNLNPYTKAGDYDTDTLLNERTREFLKPYKTQENAKSKTFAKDVENLMKLYADQNDLSNALAALKFMRSAPNYREAITHLSYSEMLSLVYQGITDLKSSVIGTPLTDDDVKGRWATVKHRLAQAKHEYGNGQACTAGLFNAALEALDGVHPDVTIVHSFAYMMQDIGVEKDDTRFEERVKLALSLLGPKAGEDSYYRDVIVAHRQARADRREAEELEG